MLYLINEDLKLPNPSLNSGHVYLKLLHLNLIYWSRADCAGESGGSGGPYGRRRVWRPYCGQGNPFSGVKRSASSGSSGPVGTPRVPAL